MDPRRPMLLHQAARRRTRNGIMPGAQGLLAAIACGLSLVCLGALEAAAPPAPAEERPADDALHRIEERGKRIAGAIEAVRRAQDLLARQGEGIAQPDSIVTIEDHDVWRVIFLKEGGKMAEPGMPNQGTVIVAETEYSPAAEDVGALRVMNPPRGAPATTVSYARALKVAEDAAAGRKEAAPPFDSAVLREKDGTFTVYLQARPKEAAKIPFGADLVARVAASGRQLVSIEPLHSESTLVPLGGRPSGQPTLHSHATGDLPTPTDIAQVCLHAALAPHLVLTKRFIYRIDSQGSLTYLGPNQAPATAPPAGQGGRP